jgi:hypothetical protein
VPSHVIGDRIPVPLLGEEELAVGGEGLVDGVAGDEGVEVRLGAVLLGVEDTALAHHIGAQRVLSPRRRRFGMRRIRPRKARLTASESGK